MKPRFPYLLSVLFTVTACEKKEAGPGTTPPQEASPPVDVQTEEASDDGELPSSVTEAASDVMVTVTIPGEAATFENAVVRVRIEDVSKADAEAEVVSKAEMPGISHESGQELSLEVPVRRPVSFDEGKSYSVAVHVDVDGNGEVDAADLITTESIPVLTNGAPADVGALVSPAG